MMQAYVPFNGRLYELDGLNSAPVDHGVVGNDGWYTLASKVVQERIAAFGGNSEGALAAYTLDFLGSRRQSEYGKIRCFTSVGWGLSSAIIGVVTSRCGFVYCLYGYVRGAQSNCGGHAQCHPSPILCLGAPVLAVGHRNAANGAAAGLPPPPDARRAQPQR